MDNQRLYESREYFNKFLMLGKKTGVLIHRATGMILDQTQSELIVDDGKSYYMSSIMRSMQFVQKVGDAPLIKPYVSKSETIKLKSTVYLISDIINTQAFQILKQTEALSRKDITKVGNLYFRSVDVLGAMTELNVKPYEPVKTKRTKMINGLRYNTADLEKLVSNCNLQKHLPGRIGEPTIDDIKKLVRYVAATGHLIWKKRTPEMFDGSGVICKNWNDTYFNQRAFCTGNGEYHSGSINGCRKQASHVVWFIHNGVWPVMSLTNINGVLTDNRIENIQYKGIFETDNGKWQSEVKHAGSHKFLMIYDTFDEAVAGKLAYMKNDSEQKRKKSAERKTHKQAIQNALNR